MNNNYAKYIEDIYAVLEKTEVTDGGGVLIRQEAGFDVLIEKSEKTRKQQGLFFLCGNGASASMAEHLSHDCFQNADFLTMTCSETTHITAISNDFSYSEVFAYRIKKVMSEKDMLVTISSSGNSPNIIRAIESAREQSSFIVTFSGMKPDNKSRKMGDLNFYVPAVTYGMVESAHATLLHCWLDLYLDKYKSGRH
jgi:D-sedoheptulose 7-phosphate isomerase